MVYRQSHMKAAGFDTFPKDTDGFLAECRQGRELGFDGKTLTEVQSLAREGTRLSQVAVLYRSNAQSRVVEHALFSQGIPYRVYGGLQDNGTWLSFGGATIDSVEIRGSDDALLLSAGRVTARWDPRRFEYVASVPRRVARGTLIPPAPPPVPPAPASSTRIGIS